MRVAYSEHMKRLDAEVHQLAWPLPSVTAHDPPDAVIEPGQARQPAAHKAPSLTLHDSRI